MFEYKINTINHKFENVKEEVNNGKLLVFAKWEVEDLLDEAIELKLYIETHQAKQDLDALIKQLEQYLCEVEEFLSKDCSTTL